MPRFSLRGLHSTVKRLADGTKRAYWYAWRNGPRLPGSPGEPEFMAAYAAAVENSRPKHVGTLQHVLNAYQASLTFRDLAERTRGDYVKQIRKIEAEFGDLPIEALAIRGIRDELRQWHERMAKTSRRQADYALDVLGLILSWAEDLGRVPTNPVKKLHRRRRKRQSRRNTIWTEPQEAAFMATAPEQLRLVLQLALWTGQRQGDLLRLPWSAYDGQTIRLTQGKTGEHVSVPVAPALKALLDATPRRAVTILTTIAGTSWTESGFRASWRTARKRAGVSGVTFHDLRGTAVVRLARGGATIPQIASFTGHSLKDVTAILGGALSRQRPGAF